MSLCTCSHRLVVFSVCAQSRWHGLHGAVHLGLSHQYASDRIASHRIASHAHAAASSITRRVTPPTACCAPHTHSRPAHPLPRPDIVLRSLIVFACASCSPGRQLNTSNRLLARAPTCGRLPSTSAACTPWSKPARGSPGMYACLLVFPFPLVLLSCCVAPVLVCAPVAIKIKKLPSFTIAAPALTSRASIPS
jgi:hypothetical protein